VRNGEEYRQNQQIRRGIVIDRDPKKMKAKVQFEDEDDVVTQWIDAGANSSTGVSFFHMPGMGDEVWCAMDAKGEAGCIISSKYNAKDKPPADSNDIVALKWGGGIFTLDTASGAITLETPGVIRFKASQIILDGEIDLGGEGGQLLHRKGDTDSDGDAAVGSASRVRAV
jgi:phage baseplate assembly protein gpV